MFCVFYVFVLYFDEFPFHLHVGADFCFYTWNWVQNCVLHHMVFVLIFPCLVLVVLYSLLVLNKQYTITF